MKSLVCYALIALVTSRIVFVLCRYQGRMANDWMDVPANDETLIRIVFEMLQVRQY